jgi:P-type Ca2+ transporter type 2C
VLMIAIDPGDPDVMHRAPRDVKVPIANRNSIIMWICYAAVLLIAGLVPLVFGPDQPQTDRPSASLTMTFVIMGLGTLFNGLVNRRDPATGLDAPILKALVIGLVSVTLLFLATQLPTLQRALLTEPLTVNEWVACFGLAALLPAVIEIAKVVRRRRIPQPNPSTDVQHVVSPERALSAGTH